MSDLRDWLDCVESGVCADCTRVAVVRCKDCKHYVTDFGALMICEVYDTPKLDSDFCSWGERDERIEE